jgi:hypothetical protein
MRAIDIPAESASALRELLRQSREAYVVFEETQKRIRNWTVGMAGPIRPGEIAALRKDSDRIEVVTHDEYLTDTKKERWH